MKTIGAREAKTQLPALLEDVRNGERYTITRHGIPVAVLIPAVHKGDPRVAIERLRNLRRGVKLDGVSIRELIEQGRSR
jgi:prevent-host-death family protein